MPADLPVLEGIALRPTEEREALLEAVHRWEVALADEARPSPGAAALLGELAREGLPVGIVTRNSRETARRALIAAGLAPFFPDHLVVGRHEAPPKPAPDGVLWLLATWGAAPSEAVMVGDWTFDLVAARAAGVRAIWLDVLRTGELAGLADRVVHSLEELLIPEG